MIQNVNKTLQQRRQLQQGADAPASAAPGSSPSHRAPAASEHSAPGPESESGKPKIPQDVSEVSWADSFIMSVC